MKVTVEWDAPDQPFAVKVTYKYVRAVQSFVPATGVDQNFVFHKGRVLIVNAALVRSILVEDDEEEPE